MQPIQTADFRTQTDLKDLDRVLAWFEQFQDVKVCQIPENVWLQCQLALVEGFTNAVRHAHRHVSSDTPIDLQVSLFNDRLDISIWDYGPGFDMETWLAKTANGVDKNSEGGRGVRLIAKISDQMQYVKEPDGRNRLYMQKNFSCTNIDTTPEDLNNSLRSYRQML
ncbi:MAG: ATP-binding protein [Cyanobacteria bacterium P01_H01_bin.119]